MTTLKNNLGPAESLFTRSLHNVKLFTVGTHTDSGGNTKTFSAEQLRSAVNAFNEGVVSAVPVKMGHSSEEFNNKVADALGIPIPLLVGEGPMGKGAVRLGALKAVRFLAGSLFGDFALPDKVAESIEQGYLSDLSVEMQFNRHHAPSKAIYPCVLSGIAFLGAQRPALGKLLPGLQSGTLYEDGTSYSAFEQSLDSNFQWGNYEDDFPSRGQSTVDPSIATDMEVGAGPYTVPFKLATPTGGRQIFATVSAANEISARNVAWRVIENFLLSAGGPAGTILGTIVGGVIGKRLLMGKPKAGGSLIGNIRWKSSEQESTNSYLFGGKEYTELLKDILRYEVPQNVDPNAWSQ